MSMLEPNLRAARHNQYEVICGWCDRRLLSLHASLAQKVDVTLRFCPCIEEQQAQDPTFVRTAIVALLV